MQSRLLRLNDDEWRWILKEVFGFCCANVVQKWQKKIATDWCLISCDFKVLPWKDSNPHRRNQNPTCYHYTTRQFFVCHRVLFWARLLVFPFDGAKVGVCFESCKYFGSFFQCFFLFIWFFVNRLFGLGLLCGAVAWFSVDYCWCWRGVAKMQFFWFFCGGLHWDRLRCLWVLAKCVGDDQVSWI